MLDCTSVHTPGYGLELSKEQPEDKLFSEEGNARFQASFGSVFYLAQVSRKDICYAFN